MKLSIVTPTFNEAENIPALIKTLTEVLDGVDYEVIVSDDDSPDLTWSIVQEISRSNSRVRLLRRLTNRGLSASVIDGFNCATGDAIACIDADLQHDPTILSEMIKELANGSDLVIGSRYVAGGGTGRWGWLRHFESWVATKLAQWVVGVKVCDPMSGYFMMRRADFMRIRTTLDARGFKILLEIATHLKPSKVCEVPYTFRTRSVGKSKLSSKVVYEYLVQLWKLSPLTKLVPAEFAKFAIVGGSGVLVNLSVMAAILVLTSYHNWRASAVATLAATLNNYVLNNFWTFRDRAHTGMTFVHRYMFYLMASLVGLAGTTGTFVVSSWLLAHALDLDSTHSTLPAGMLLLCQLLAIGAGTLSNYELNRLLTWPRRPKQSRPGFLVSEEALKGNLETVARKI
jgi:dolichol-phosphate mannosyltransferase